MRRGIRQGDGGTGPAYPPGLLWLEGRSGERRGRPPWAVEARAGPRPPSPPPPVVRRLTTPSPSLTLHLSSISRLTAATSPFLAASCSLPISGRWNCPRLPVLPAAGGRRGGITSWDGDGAPFKVLAAATNITAVRDAHQPRPPSFVLVRCGFRRRGGRETVGTGTRGTCMVALALGRKGGLGMAEERGSGARVRRCEGRIGSARSPQVMCGPRRRGGRETVGWDGHARVTHGRAGSGDAGWARDD